jgi:hypothetical protein
MYQLGHRTDGTPNSVLEPEHLNAGPGWSICITISSASARLHSAYDRLTDRPITTTLAVTATKDAGGLCHLWTRSCLLATCVCCAYLVWTLSNHERRSSPQVSAFAGTAAESISPSWHAIIYYRLDLRLTCYTCNSWSAGARSCDPQYCCLLCDTARIFASSTSEIAAM